MKPSVGRIVHFHTAHELPTVCGCPLCAGNPVIVPGPPLAALVLRCGPDGEEVTLKVFYPDGSETLQTNVPFSEEPKPGHWSRPPYVGPAPSTKP